MATELSEITHTTHTNLGPVSQGIKICLLDLSGPRAQNRQEAVGVRSLGRKTGA